MKKMTFLITLICFAILGANWSTDPATNNQISGLTGDQAIPKTAMLPDGSCYFGWWSNATGNYNMRLQYLDANGSEQWETNGILISDNAQMSWLTDWDMTCDHDGNAIMAFNDIREGEDQLDIFAYKISSEGEFVWGENGINLSNGGFNAAPKVTVTANNNCIYAWADETVIKAVGISPQGNLLWENPIIIDEPDTSNWPQLIPADDGSEGNFMIKYYVNTGPYWAPDRAVYLQKYNTMGNPVWDSPAVVSDAYGISAWTQVISFTSDGNGGALLSWHDDRNSENTTRAYVQHISSDGTSSFDDGVLVADHSPNQMYYPSAVYQPDEDMIYCYWRETDSNQNNAGIYGQKIDLEGNLLYTNTGISVSPIQSTGGTIIGLRPAGEDVVVVYTLYPWGNFTSEQILSKCYDPEGEEVWDDALIISDMQTSKGHTDMADVFWNENGFLPDDGMIISWDGDGIYAQRFNFNGTIGEPPVELPAPYNLTASFYAGASTVDLAWEMETNRDLTGFQIFCNDELLEEVMNPDITSYVDGVDQYIDYTYYVTAIYDEGISDPSNTVTIFPEELALAPLNFEVDSATAILTWSPPPLPPRELIDYKIFLNGSFVTATLDTTYQYTDLTAGETYTAGLMAEYTLAGESECLLETFTYDPVNNNENTIEPAYSLNIYPNPFNPETKLSFSITEAQKVNISVYNTKGQLVKILTDSYMQAGKHDIVWNAEKQSSGIYYVSLKTPTQKDTKSIVLLK